MLLSRTNFNSVFRDVIGTQLDVSGRHNRHVGSPLYFLFHTHSQLITTQGSGRPQPTPSPSCKKGTNSFMLHLITFTLTVAPGVGRELSQRGELV
jgi:hypothetical protein